MLKKRVKKCSTPECGRDVHYPSLGICHACYQFLYYWKDRSVADKVKHTNKINRWEARAKALLLPQQVTTISTSRRRRKRAAG